MMDSSGDYQTHVQSLIQVHDPHIDVTHADVTEGRTPARDLNTHLLSG